VVEPMLNGPGVRDERGTSTRGVVAVMRRWRWMILLAALAAAAAGYAVASTGSAKYESHAVLLVGPIETADADALRASGQLAETYAAFATSKPVLNATSRRVGGVQDIEDSVSASANAVTRLLTISVVTSDAQLSSRIANTEARVLIDVAARGQRAEALPIPPPGTTTEVAPKSGSLRVVDPAEASTTPAGRGALAIAILAAIGGLLGALGLALLLDRSGDSISDLEELREVTGSGVLATMTPAVLATRRRRVASRTQVKRDFHLLAAKLNAVGDRSLLVAVLDADGLTFTTHLAEALVATGVTVAVIDAGNPQVAATRDAVLADARPTARAGSDDAGDGAGDGSGDSASWPLRFVNPPAFDDGRGADAARGVIDDLLTDADVVLVSPPPLEQSPGALTWARVVDGTMLVVQLERTGRSQLSAVVENLRLVHARLLGTVVASGTSMLRR